jgi:hypothetical protein
VLIFIKCVLVFSVFCIDCAVFLYCFFYVYAFLPVWPVLSRVTTHLQLIIIIIIIIIIMICTCTYIIFCVRSALKVRIFDICLFFSE